MSLARRSIRGLQRLVPPRCDQLVSLGYHLVGAGTGSPVDLPVATFIRQLDELREIAEVVALSAALDGQGEVAAPGRPRVVLTFDDAYGNFGEVVWPLLAERGLPATLFVPVGFVEGECPAPIAGTGNLEPLAWEELARMTASGLLTVGSHSWSHPDLRKLDSARVRVELVRSRQRIEERLAVPVETFCYPRGLWNRRVERLVGEEYRCAAMGGGRGMREEGLQPGSDPAGRGAGRFSGGAGREGERVRRPVRLWRTPVRRDSPPSVAPVVTAPVWLEEWIANAVRRAR